MKRGSWRRAITTGFLPSGAHSASRWGVLRCGECSSSSVAVSFNLPAVNSGHDAHHGSSAFAAGQVKCQIGPQGA
jgi:hypothetical protein